MSVYNEQCEYCGEYGHAYTRHGDAIAEVARESWILGEDKNIQTYYDGPED